MQRWSQVCAAIALTASTWLPAIARADGPSVTECLTANADAIKLDNEHKLRAERKQLLVCAAESCPPEIRQECTKRLEQVSQAVPSIVFDVRDATGADMSVVKVTMDGEVLAERLIGTAIELDPGEHQFTFEVAGQPAVSKTFVIRVSEQNRRENIVFDQLNRAPAAVPAPPPPAPPPAAPLPAPVPESKSLSGRRIAALVAGGVGVVGLGIGGAFGIDAISQRNKARTDCPNATCRTKAGSDEWSQAKFDGQHCNRCVYHRWCWSSHRRYALVHRWLVKRKSPSRPRPRRHRTEGKLVKSCAIECC